MVLGTKSIAQTSRMISIKYYLQSSKNQKKKSSVHSTNKKQKTLVHGDSGGVGACPEIVHNNIITGIHSSKIKKIPEGAKRRTVASTVPSVHTIVPG